MFSKLALWIVPKVEKFPKGYRFSIGQNLVTYSLDLLMNLVDAGYETRNACTPGAAVRDINQVRYLIRLSKDLHLLNVAGLRVRLQGSRRNRPHDGRMVEKRPRLP